MQSKIAALEILYQTVAPFGVLNFGATLGRRKQFTERNRNCSDQQRALVRVVPHFLDDFNGFADVAVGVACNVSGK